MSELKKPEIEVLRFLGSGEFRTTCDCQYCKKVPEALAYAIEAIKYNEKLKEQHSIIIDEKCAKDEKHCTCVPSLRQEIKELVKAKMKLEQENKWLRGGMMSELKKPEKKPYHNFRGIDKNEEWNKCWDLFNAWHEQEEK